MQNMQQQQMGGGGGQFNPMNPMEMGNNMGPRHPGSQQQQQQQQMFYNQQQQSMAAAAAAGGNMGNMPAEYSQQQQHQQRMQHQFMLQQQHQHRMFLQQQHQIRMQQQAAGGGSGGGAGAPPGMYHGGGPPGQTVGPLPGGPMNMTHQRRPAPYPNPMYMANKRQQNPGNIFYPGPATRLPAGATPTGQQQPQHFGGPQHGPQPGHPGGHHPAAMNGFAMRPHQMMNVANGMQFNGGGGMNMRPQMGHPHMHRPTMSGPMYAAAPGGPVPHLQPSGSTPDQQQQFLQQQQQQHPGGQLPQGNSSSPSVQPMHTELPNVSPRNGGGSKANLSEYSTVHI
jgi:hypothetical protein